LDAAQGDVELVEGLPVGCAQRDLQLRKEALGGQRLELRDQLGVLPDVAVRIGPSRSERLDPEVVERATTPPLSQVMEFARAWVEELAALEAESPRRFYEWAVSNLESGQADVHCNVWCDEELFAQLDALVAGGFLPGLSVSARGPNRDGFNEFHLALRKDAA